MSDDGRSRTLRLDPIAGPTIDPVVPEPDTRTLLGRAAECDVCLPHAGISRRHVAVFSRGGQWLVTDLGSRHGTFLNGMRLHPHKPAITGHGDLLRIGPFMFRVDSAAVTDRALATTDATVTPDTIVTAVSARELDSLAHRRLTLMIEGSAAIYQAVTEHELAQAVIKLIMSGTGFPRAALLRWGGSPEQVEIIAFHDRHHDTSEGFTFSRSLLQTSATGRVARLSRSAEQQCGQSIEGLGISAALCAPLVVDSAVVGAIYLDSRVGEVQPQPDAASFCHAVSQIASLALSSLKRIELAQRQERLDADLRIAQEAQSFLLPAPGGTVGRLRYASRTCPGSVVGGDLFDIFDIDDHTTGICFGDITGHGIGAAILMTAVLSHLRAILASCGDPATAVAQANAYLVQHSSERMFATLWVGVYDSVDNTLRYVDAGHGHWLIRPADAAPARPQSPGGMIIGVQPDLEYSVARLELRPGDRLVLYSDGLVEQLNTKNEAFGNARLRDVIAGSGSIEDDVAGVFTALEEFTGGSSFADDTTIASIEVQSGAALRVDD
ncbi:MAG: SpoIIE family protein phosphatase [Phycisphaerales bacterium]|nr:SpoIIE family protein phosphatase [Phycisphaerales bacterium]